jgi:hypothetical protein
MFLGQQELIDSYVMEPKYSMLQHLLFSLPVTTFQEVSDQNSLHASCFPKAAVLSRNGNSSKPE